MTHITGFVYRCWLVICFVSAAGNVLSQDSLRTLALEEVVVTGQYEPQSVTKSVYQIRTIPMERIRSKGATNLQDLFNTELNLRFSQDLALGTSSLTMNGLPAQYVKVLIDGVPVVGKGAGNAVDINQINVNTIERVELVDGPMAVIFGSDAIAGVINIITKKAHQGKVMASVKMHEETVGNLYGATEGIHNQYVDVGGSHKNVYARIEGGRNYFGGWHAGVRNRSRKWYPKTQWLFGGLTGFKNETIDVYYRLDILDETLENRGDFVNGHALDQNYIVSRYMHQLQGNVVFNEKLNYNAVCSFTDFARRTQSVNVEEATGKETLSLGEAHQDVTAFKGMTFRGSVQYKLAKNLMVQPGYDVNTETGSGGRLKPGNHGIRDYAAFVSAEYAPLALLSVRPGVRMIRNSKYEAPPLVTSLNVKITTGSTSDVRVSYARGFRAPTLRELYFIFFDANHSIEGNPRLNAEHSHNFNTSFTWKGVTKSSVTFSYVLSGFYNNIDDMITLGFLPGNRVVSTYINIAKYKSTGVQCTSAWRYKHLNVNAGLAFTGRYKNIPGS